MIKRLLRPCAVLAALATAILACAPAGQTPTPPAKPPATSVLGPAGSPVLPAGASPPATASPLPAAASPSPAAAASPAAASSPAASPGPGAPSYPTIQIASKPATVRIGYQVIPNSELLAKQLRMHEQAFGVPIEWRQFDSGRDVNTAMASGSIDIGLVGSAGTAAGIAQNLPYEVIAIYDVEGDNESLVAKAGINSIADLKGKKVAAPFGSTTHYSLLKVLQLNNINQNELTIIDMQPPDMLAAWTRGDIDAGYVWQPTLQKMLDSGGKRLISSAEVAARGFPTSDVAVAHRDFTSKYPDLVAVYVQDLSKATDLFRSDPDRASQDMAKELNLTAPSALQQMKELIWLNSFEQLEPSYFGSTQSPGDFGNALKQTADFLVDQKTIRSAPDLATYQQAANPAYLQRSVGR